MTKKIINKTIFGIITGFSVMTFTLLILLLVTHDSEVFLTKSHMITNIWVSAVVGIAFSLPSIIYDYEKIPNSIQSIIHMGTGYTVFFPLAFYAKWIPVKDSMFAILGTIVCFILVSMSVWLGFYLYYRKEAKLINQRLKILNEQSEVVR